MSFYHSPRITTSGLILLLDPGNPKSYPGTSSEYIDLSGRGNHHTVIASPTWSENFFSLNGSTQGFRRSTTLNGATTSCTVVIWYATTDISELWVRGNQSNSWYLSASSNNNYYHSNCGSPINYVDLNVTLNPTASGYKDDKFHMFEAKRVDFSAWNYFEWFLYPGGWQLDGDVAMIAVYDRELAPSESAQNYYAMQRRYI
jgi:hypothetical protein